MAYVPKYLSKSIGKGGKPAYVYKYAPERRTRINGYDETFPATHYVSRGGRRPKTLFLSGGSIGRSMGPGSARYYGKNLGFTPTLSSVGRMKRLIRAARGD